MKYSVTTVIEKDKDGYYAYCPKLKGCQSQGETLDDAMANIEEAIKLYVSTMSHDEVEETLSNRIITTAIEVDA